MTALSAFAWLAYRRLQLPAAIERVARTAMPSRLHQCKGSTCSTFSITINIDNNPAQAGSKKLKFDSSQPLEYMATLMLLPLQNVQFIDQACQQTGGEISAQS